MGKFPLDDLNKMDKAALVAALGDIYEHAPWVARSRARATAVRDACVACMKR